MTPAVIATIVTVAVVIGLARLFVRPKRPPTAKFKCARCGTVVLHSARTENAWRGGAKRLFCDVCHRKWLSAQPAKADSTGSGRDRSLVANRGCLGIALFLVACPFALYWVYAYA
jgi:hypothetical protein